MTERNELNLNLPAVVKDQLEGGNIFEHLHAFSYLKDQLERNKKSLKFTSDSRFIFTTDTLHKIDDCIETYLKKLDVELPLSKNILVRFSNTEKEYLYFSTDELKENLKLNEEAITYIKTSYNFSFFHDHPSIKTRVPTQYSIDISINTNDNKIEFDMEYFDSDRSRALENNIISIINETVYKMTQVDTVIKYVKDTFLVVFFLSLFATVFLGPHFLFIKEYSPYSYGEESPSYKNEDTFRVEQFKNALKEKDAGKKIDKLLHYFITVEEKKINKVGFFEVSKQYLKANYKNITFVTGTLLVLMFISLYIITKPYIDRSFIYLHENHARDVSAITNSMRTAEAVFYAFIIALVFFIAQYVQSL